MKTRKQYSYSILRYVHDTATGEFVNVGVALHSFEDSFFKVKVRSTVGRIAEIFPDLKTHAFRSLMRSLTNRFTALGKAYACPLELSNKTRRIEDLMHSVLPKDDSSLVWSPVASGLTEDPSDTIEKLYVRYVSKYDAKKSLSRRTDDDVWRGFKKDLEDRRIIDFFNEKVIQDNGDEVKFPFAWKNGIWHCVEPISFDLSAPESIKDKAHKCLGQITSISDNNFKIYLLVSPPTEKKLAGAFETALSILGKMPVESEIYYEQDKGNLLDKLSKQIEIHEAGSTH